MKFIQTMWCEVCQRFTIHKVEKTDEGMLIARCTECNFGTDHTGPR